MNGSRILCTFTGRFFSQMHQVEYLPLAKVLWETSAVHVTACDLLSIVMKQRRIMVGDKMRPSDWIHPRLIGPHHSPSFWSSKKSKMGWKHPCPLHENHSVLRKVLCSLFLPQLRSGACRLSRFWENSSYSQEGRSHTIWKLKSMWGKPNTALCAFKQRICGQWNSPLTGL